MQLGKCLLNERHPEKVRVLTSCEVGKRLAVILGDTRKSVIDYHKELPPILEEPEDIEPVFAVLFESPLANKLVELLLFNCYHAKGIEEPSVFELSLDDPMTVNFVSLLQVLKFLLGRL